MQPTSVNITSDNKPTVQEIETLQRTFVSPMAMAAGSMGQPAKGTFPAIIPSTLPSHPDSIPAIVSSTLPSHSKSGKQRWIILTLVLLILVVAGMVVYALSKGPTAPSASNQPSLVGHGSPPGRNKVTDHLPVAVLPGFAAISITATSKDVKNVFTISAVTGTTDSSQSHVQARQVTASQSQSQTTTATGSNQVPATPTTGTMPVTCRASSPPLTIIAGTVFTGNDKVSVATDTTLTTSGCHTTIPTHAVNPVQSGNIAAKDVNQPYKGYNVLYGAPFTSSQNPNPSTVVTPTQLA